jgi:hypothetical protein
MNEGSGSSDVAVLLQVHQAFESIEDDAAYERVLQFLANKRGMRVVRAGASVGVSGDTALSPERDEADEVGPDFPTVFDGAHPQTEADKALVAGYYLQAIMGQQDFDSASLHDMLRELGHELTNISRAMTALMATTPNLVMQTGRVGKGHHVRKRYRLTQAGINRVATMLGRSLGGATPNEMQ